MAYGIPDQFSTQIISALKRDAPGWGTDQQVTSAFQDAFHRHGGFSEGSDYGRIYNLVRHQLNDSYGWGLNEDWNTFNAGTPGTANVPGFSEADMQARWQATQEDDSLFGDLTPLILGAGGFFGAPLLAGALGGGLAGSLGAGALIGGGGGLLTGGDPLKGALFGAAGAGIGSALGGGLGGASDFGAENMFGFDAAGAQELAGLSNASGGSTGGSGMWDWLENLGSDFDASAFGGDQIDMTGFGGDFSADAFGGQQFDMTGFGSQFDLGNTGGTIIGEGWSPDLGGLGLSDVLSKVRSAMNLSSLFGGGNASGGGTSGRSSGGGILDSILGDPLGAAFNATPFLLALSEANRQGKDLDGVLNSINSDSYRNSVLNPYDMDTSAGRMSMLNDQEMRQVRGSSFGDQSLGNYDYMRALGRGDLASKAGVATAGLQGNLINARNTNRNLLLGAGLNASGRLFSPQKDPFNLSALLGIG